MPENGRRESDWNECEYHARHIDEHGKEIVVTCDLGKHAAPGDTNVRHHDPHLEIWWAYDDNELRFDDEEDGAEE